MCHCLKNDDFVSYHLSLSLSIMNVDIEPVEMSRRRHGRLDGVHPQAPHCLHLAYCHGYFAIVSAMRIRPDGGLASEAMTEASKFRVSCFAPLPLCAEVSRGDT